MGKRFEPLIVINIVVNVAHGKVDVDSECIKGISKIIQWRQSGHVGD